MNNCKLCRSKLSVFIYDNDKNAYDKDCINLKCDYGNSYENNELVYEKLPIKIYYNDSLIKFCLMIYYDSNEAELHWYKNNIVNDNNFKWIPIDFTPTINNKKDLNKFIKKQLQLECLR